MILVSMRIDPGHPDTDVVEIERRLRECAREESWRIERLEVWQPADDETIASLKAALESGAGAEGHTAVDEQEVTVAQCPACRREVQVQGGRLARHHDRVLKRLCKGSGGPLPRR
jgi:hypothetical protein